MLLIGSRAIRFHAPSFREPVDWDVIANDDEADWLLNRLPKPRTATCVQPTQSDDKFVLQYQGAQVEVARTSRNPYWKLVCDHFANAPTMEDPVLGTLRIPSLSYLMGTKQCALAYPVKNWHKNLKDVFVLKEYLHDLDPRDAYLWEATMGNAERVYGAAHRGRRHALFCCHPKVPDAQNPKLHQMLHERLALRGTPAASEEGAWQGFKTLPSSERKPAMVRVLCEEAQVLAAERVLAGDDPERVQRLDRAKRADAWLRWALRELAIGPLPLGWRYFLVNHYDEVRDMVPPDWVETWGDLAVP